MKFSDIPGNEAIKQMLIKTVTDRRVSHAQLFFGPEGNEKLALAIAYAQLINCTGKGVGLDSCGTCPSCIKYQKLIHPDLHFVYPVATTKKITKKPKSVDFIEEWRKFLLENNFRGSLIDWYSTIGIENKQGIINAEDCGEIIHTLSYKSYESEYKVMILWMVEKLYYAAAPKILKILEEPPDKTVFILISEDPDQIISTIRSRTLLVRIPKSDVQGDRMDDTGNFDIFSNWMRLCFKKDIIALVSWSGEIAKAGRENQKNLLQYSLKILQQSVANNYGNEQAIVSSGEELNFVKKIAPFFHSGNIVAFTQLFHTALYHIERNGHAPTIFLDISLQAIRLFHSSGKKIGK
jgi:DNA polymerase III subunit delta'